MRASLLVLLLSVASAGQPRVRYSINARLDPTGGTISGTESVWVTRPGADFIPRLHFRYFADAFRDPASAYARERAASGRFDLALAPPSARGLARALVLGLEGVPLEDVVVGMTGADAVVSVVRFEAALPAVHGELGRNGRNCLLVHWYPQLARDSVGEYHLFQHAPSLPADYEVRLTLPADLAVASNAGVAEADWLRWPPGLRQGTPDSARTWQLSATGISDLVAVISPRLALATDTAAGTDVGVFYRCPARPNWLGLERRVADMIRVYRAWYGPPPFRQLSVVQADGLALCDAVYPGLIVLASRPIPGTRLFQSTLARLVAAQWFTGPHSVDELSEPWQALGPAAAAEMRYMQLRFGPSNLIDQPLLNWLLRGLSAEYVHRLYRYVAETNGLLLPVGTSPHEFRDQFEYSAANVSAAGLLVLDSLRASDSSILTPPSSLLPSSDRLFIPLLSLPDFNRYHVFFGPYAWYDSYHGFQLEAWVQGRRFIDAGPLRGSHNWTFTEAYFTRLDDWHSSLWYQTPLTVVNPRLRLIVRADYSEITAEARVGLQQELGRVFGRPNALAEVHYRLVAMRDILRRDPAAWDTARTADIRAQFTHNYETARWLGRERIHAAWGSRRLGSEHDYWKLWLEQSHLLRLNSTAGIRVRAFAGAILGTVPNQDQYYLSGGLASNSDEPVSWGYQGWTSGQERWHYDADCNLRGYAGTYKHGPTAWAFNLYLQPAKLVQPFFDIGAVADSIADPRLTRPMMDAGLRLRLGPLYADFPLWVSAPDSGRPALAFRWMLGLRLTD